MIAYLKQSLAKANGPDRGLDREIMSYVLGQAITTMEIVPKYTASIDEVGNLVRKELPGWGWKVGTCCVSDDAWVAPDYNCPVHGERLREQFGPVFAGSIWDAGVDIDLRPSGRMPIALCLAVLEAIEAIRDPSGFRGKIEPYDTILYVDGERK